MKDVYRHEDFTPEQKFGIILFQLSYGLGKSYQFLLLYGFMKQLIMTDLGDKLRSLKDAFCAENKSNINYGDDIRMTMLPSYCDCRDEQCVINGLVKEYKAIVKSFTELYPNKLGYTMCI